MNLKEIKEKLKSKYNRPLLKKGITFDEGKICIADDKDQKKLNEYNKEFYESKDFSKLNLYFYNPLFSFLKNEEYKSKEILESSFFNIPREIRSGYSLFDFHKSSASKKTSDLIKSIVKSHNKPGIYYLLQDRLTKNKIFETGVCLIPFDFNSHLGDYVKRRDKLKEEENFLSLMLSSNDLEFFGSTLSRNKIPKTINDTKNPLTISKLAPCFLSRMSKEESDIIYSILKIYNGDFVYEGDSNPLINYGDVLFCDGVSYFSDKLVISRSKELDSYFSKV